MSKINKLLGIGTRVQFLNTANTGVITEKLGDGLLMIRLDDDKEEIPVFEEDVERYDINKQLALSYEPPNAGNSKPKTQNSKLSFILKHTGIHLLFEPIQVDGALSHYTAFFQNDTVNDISFGVDLVLNGKVSVKHDSTLSVACLAEVFSLPVHALNDAPEIDVQIFFNYTDGTVQELNKTLKLKAKSFFKAPQFSEALGRDVILLTVFEKLSEQTNSNQSDLEKYTASLLKEKHKREAEQNRLNTPVERVNVSDYAHFVNEIDLHIEMLHDNPRTLDNAEIVRIQIAAFENYLAKAIQVGVPRVFIIHGLGTGRLKELIAARLRRNANVAHYKNEYHARYGFGATEVMFG